MNGKLNLLLTIVIALIAISLFSCMERGLLAPPSETNDDTIQTIQKDSTLNKSMCSVKYVRRWNTEKILSYVPVAGKKLGFNNSEFASIREMKEKYGFSKVTGADHTFALNTGFLRADIMGSISWETLSYSTGYDSYYIDEPIENGVSVASILYLARKLYPKKLILGSYKIGIIDWANVETQYKILKRFPNIYIMSDNYYGFYVRFWGHRITTKQDQRGYWGDFKTSYGSKNRANWISLIVDAKASRGDGDFYDLLGWANDNGLKEMWLWIGKAPAEEDYEELTQSKFNRDIKKFVEAAYFKGWLKRKEFQKEYYWKYICLLPQPCRSCDQEDESAAGWLFVSKKETGRVRTIIR